MIGDSSGGDDRLLIQIAIFCTIVTILSTSMLTIMLPTADGSDDYTDVLEARQEVADYTGLSMVNLDPWELTGIYTPYHIGDPQRIANGWLYGQSVVSAVSGGDTAGQLADSVYSKYIGQSSDIKLNPAQKSVRPLGNSETSVDIITQTPKWWADSEHGGTIIRDQIAQWFSHTFNKSQTETHHHTEEYGVWEYTGYRYEFAPMLPFGDQSASAADGRLSIVWYDWNGQQGISGGLVIFGGDEGYKGDQTILASYSAADIIANYNLSAAHASQFNMNFDGIPITLNIRFGPDVYDGTESLTDAWNNGDWTLAFTSESVGNYMDLKNSASFTNSVGDIVGTFIDIFTFDLPDLNNSYYQYILWIIVVLPAEMALMLFLSRFGVAGVGAGIAGNLIAFALG